jgi:large subunit ribosomal protein L24
VQTTLLGLAIAIILALVTALVGPLFVDWGRWRTSFEAEATRLVGMPVRVSGRIDARLLPTPSLLLNGIEVGEPGREAKLRARTLGVEFALGPLLRGEWRAAQLHLDGPEVTLGIDAAGRIDVPQVSIGFDPDQLSFERVAIDNGRAVLVDAASGTRLVLDQLAFKGNIRSLVGPFSGEGAFVSSGQLYGYGISGSRPGDDGGMRMRLSLDPADRPLAIQTDGMLRVDHQRPRYEGSLVLARPAGFALSNGKTIASEPWRAASRITATSASALLEQLDFQYGPDERAIKLAGTAELRFGAKPRFEGVLSARQIDLDRALLMPDATRRTPVALLRGMADTLSEFAHLPVPVRIGIGIDSVTLGGGLLTAVRGDVLAEGDAWSLDNLEFRAPGATQVRASGSLKLAPGAAEFAGPASVDSADPRQLVAWLEGRPEPTRAMLGALRARGDVTLGVQRLAVERLNAEFDHKSVAGRLAYVFAADQRPARLDAAISAAEIDLDGAIAFAGNALAGTTFERPGEIALALDVGRATYAGVDAKGASANLKFDASGLVIERLAIADFGGAVLGASGRIDTTSPSPRGSLALTLDAQRLTGVTALAAKFWPAAAGTLQVLTQRAASAKLSAKLDVAPLGATGEAKSLARLAVDGAIAGVRVTIAAEGRGDIAAPAAADFHLDGHLDADDGAGLAALVGLDRLAVADHRAARLSLSASGPAAGDVGIDAKFNGAGLDAAAKGTLRVADGMPHGGLAVRFTAADTRLWRRDPAALMPVTLATRLSLDGDRVVFDGLDGKIAGAGVKGRLALVRGHPMRIDGRLDADALDAPAVIAGAIGSPASAHGATPWSSEPFGPGPLNDVDGQIVFSVARAAVAPGIMARDLHGTARFEQSALTLENLAGSVGEGRLAAQMRFGLAATGLSMQAGVSLTNADLSALMPRAAFGQVAGRVSFRSDVQATGLSPAALVGALQGSGSATVENLQIAGFDPKAIDAALSAADRGVAIDAVRIGDVVRSALDTGRLNIPDLAGAVAIDAGRVVITPLTAPAQSADVAITGSYGVGDDALDLRFGLTGAPKPNAPNGQRPEISLILRGPLDAARRTVEVGALVNWLASRAVEQETRRLEAAEQEAKRVQAQEEARRKQEAERRQQEEARRKLDEERRAQEAAAATGAIAEPAKPAAPAFDKAPDLPPAIIIGPAPGSGEAKQRHVPPRPDRATTAVPPSAPLVITPFDPR